MQALFRSDPRLSSLVHMLPSRLPALPPKGFSNIAFALAVLRWKDPQLMTLLANETVRRIQEFSPQGISITVWAFASLGILEPHMMEEAAAMVMQRIRKFNPQELANTTWAFSTLLVHHDGLVEVLGEEASRRSADLDASSRSTLSEALMQLGALADWRRRGGR